MNIKNLMLHAFFVFSALFIFSSCKKELTPDNTESVPPLVKAVAGAIPPYIFNWETATYMPSSPSNQIQMPWNSGQTAIDPAIAGDIKASDGWQLVWNTFSDTKAANDPNYLYFFSLYNVYRGLLRFYLWQPAATVATSYVNHGLGVYTTGYTSPMLNFNATDLINAGVNSPSFSLILNQQINSSGGTWFVFQYEIAYDPGVASTTFPAFGLSWTSQWASISTITLNGTQTGTIKGNIGNPVNAFDAGQNLAKGVTTAMLTVDYSAWGAMLDGSASNGSYHLAASDAFLGIVKNFFNGIMGGSTAQTVNLTINTKINLSGNIVTNGGMENIKLALPGQSNSQTADGNTPAFNNIMGIFNLSARPKIFFDYYVNTYTTSDPSSGEDVILSYSDNYYQGIDNNSFAVNWNPAIINSNSSGATIQNYKQEIVFLSNYQFGERHDPNPPDYNLYQDNSYPIIVNGSATTEKVGSYYVCAQMSSSSLMEISVYGGDQAQNTVGVRISFDVVPNNGTSPKATIVKTFVADLERH